jgi:hypothetical protein
MEGVAFANSTTGIPQSSGYGKLLKALLGIIGTRRIKTTIRTQKR